MITSPNGRVYIGSTKDFKFRTNEQHRTKLK